MGSNNLTEKKIRKINKVPRKKIKNCSRSTITNKYN